MLKMENELVRSINTIEKKLLTSKVSKLDFYEQGKFLFSKHAEKIIPKEPPIEQNEKIKRYYLSRQIFEDVIHDLSPSKAFHQGYADATDHFFHDLYKSWNLWELFF